MEVDDTSSTTTESSVEAAMPSLGSTDHVTTPAPVKTKKSKGKGSARKRDLVENLHEAEYIIGSRSKLHKKIDTDLAGNILKARYKILVTVFCASSRILTSCASCMLFICLSKPLHMYVCDFESLYDIGLTTLLILYIVNIVMEYMSTVYLK